SLRGPSTSHPYTLSLTTLFRSLPLAPTPQIRRALLPRRRSPQRRLPDPRKELPEDPQSPLRQPAPRPKFRRQTHRRRRRGIDGRSEEHTSELQSLAYLVCRLLL